MKAEIAPGGEGWGQGGTEREGRGEGGRYRTEAGGGEHVVQGGHVGAALLHEVGRDLQVALPRAVVQLAEALLFNMNNMCIISYE